MFDSYEGKESSITRCMYCLIPKTPRALCFPRNQGGKAPETSQRDQDNLVSKERILGTWLDWSEFQERTPNTFIYQIGALNSH